MINTLIIPALTIIPLIAAAVFLAKFPHQLVVSGRLILAVWIAAVLIFRSVIGLGFVYFAPAQFPESTTALKLALPATIPEAVLYGLIIFVALMWHLNQAAKDRDPLYPMKKIQDDKRRWMEANGE